MAGLAYLSQKYRSRGFRVLSISIDHSRKKVKEYLGRGTPPFEVGLDPRKKAYAKFKNRGVPTFYLIDEEGRIQQTWFGWAQAIIGVAETARKAVTTFFEATMGSLHRAGIFDLDLRPAS